MSRAQPWAAATGSVDREAYIYYRIDAAPRSRAWRDRLLALQAELRTRHAGLRTGLLRRADAAGAQVTLMETYAFDPAAADAAAPDLERLLAALETGCAALPGRPDAPRHLEVFERCA